MYCMSFKKKERCKMTKTDLILAENFKNYVLVENGMENNVFLEKDIEKLVPMYSANVVLIRTENKVTDGLIAMLNQTIIEDGNRLEDRYDVQDFTDEHLQNAYVEYPNDYEYPDDCAIVYDFVEDEFSAFADWTESAINTITYLDSASNWKTLELDSITYVTISTDSVDLDEYDGSNWYTGGKFEHQNVYKVYQLDGEETTDTYLIITSSDYQGVLDVGEIMTEGELIEHLRELDRDVKKYIKEVQAL
jgi:hypothetical protein